MHDSRAVNQPGLTVSVGAIIAALGRVAGPEAAARVRIAPDPAIEAVVAGWPKAFVSTAGFDPPLAADPDFDSLLHAYLSQEVSAETSGANRAGQPSKTSR